MRCLSLTKPQRCGGVMESKMAIEFQIFLIWDSLSFRLSLCLLSLHWAENSELSLSHRPYFEVLISKPKTRDQLICIQSSQILILRLSMQQSFSTKNYREYVWGFELGHCPLVFHRWDSPQFNAHSRTLHEREHFRPYKHREQILIGYQLSTWAN